ncbi:MAG: DsbC family protein, partial [Thermodesulfobacteriota bacterium]
LDLSGIPVDKAIVIGDKKADKKIIVFSDPDCPYCQRLHTEMKKVVEKRKDVAFLIKLYPLPMHPEAYDKAKAIVCEKSEAKVMKLMDDVFSGKQISKPKAKCDATEVDNNLKLAAELGITGTPAIIFPDGRLLPGYIEADAILAILDAPADAPNDKPNDTVKDADKPKD